MLRVEYNGFFLRLAPGSNIEIERNSPAVSAENSFAEYSNPITLVYCEENVAALGTAFFEYGSKKTQRLDVNIYDHLTYRCKAKLVINKTIVNTNNRGKGNLQGFLLTGASRFFNSVKAVKLKDLKFGGKRTFNFTTWDPFDASNGYWQHFHNTWSFDDDYVVLPCRNENWVGEVGTGFMSYMGRGDWPGIGTAEPVGQFPPYSAIVPFPKVEYILNQVFIENGWSLDTSGINDEDWKKLLMLNINEVQYYNPIGLFVWPTIDIYMNKMVSPEVTCKDFVLALCNRFGWMPVIAENSNECKIFALKEIGSGVVKDFTQYMGAVIEDEYLENERKFAFKNTINGNDELNGSPDLSEFKEALVVYRKEDLPTPSSAFDLKIIFCSRDNCWYKIGLDDTNNRYWERFADNIYDEETDDATDTYTTDASTMPIFLTKHRYDLATDTYYYAYFPACSIPYNKEWGIRLLMYQGMVKELLEDGTEGTEEYPFASSVCVTPTSTTATVMAEWSNVYRHKVNDNDFGIIEYWFGKFIQATATGSKRLMNLYLPFHELISLRFNDLIMLKNEVFFLEKFIDTVPYKGYIQATLLPYNNRNWSIGVDDEAPDGNTYVRLYVEDVVTGVYESYPDTFFGGSNEYSNLTNATVIARFFSNVSGTIPKLVSGLILKSKTIITLDGSPYITLTPLEQTVGDPTPANEAFLQNISTWKMEYDYSPSLSPFNPPAGHYTQTVELLTSSDYIIIP